MIVKLDTTKVLDLVKAYAFARLTELEPATLPAPGDHGTVHDRRVAARRLRVALSVIGDSARAIEEKTEAYQDALGAIRDVHVQLEWSQEVGPEHARAVEILTERLEAELERREPELREKAEEWRHEAVPAIEALLDRLVEHGASLDGRFRKKLGETRGSLEKAVSKLSKKIGPRRAHATRIEAKKLRYLLEIAKPLFDPDVEGVLERVKDLQTTLGDLHDAFLREELLEGARAELPDEDRRAIAQLRKRAARERKKLEKGARREVARFRRAAPLELLESKLEEGAFTFDGGFVP